MQGTQSRWIPETADTETADQQSHVAGRQAEQGMLAAIHEVEAADSRPAWLRRWFSEPDHLPAASSGPLAGEKNPRTDRSRDARDTGSEIGRTADTTDVPGNGHTGQSIEAAFSYEAIFQYDTDFEAENTEDWLDLSNAQGAAPEALCDQGLASGEAESRAFSELSPDPQAVRAAIFRLAQTSGGSNRTQDIPASIVEPAVGHPKPGGAATLPKGADFADVARQVWGSDDLQDKLPLMAEEIAEGIPSESKACRATTGDTASPEQKLSATANSVSEGGGIDSVTPAGMASSETSPAKTAGGAPALAHDAGNLLSALKLYSELLALSGVLQARHSHYAEDLKLLAARSEVLIHRLLQHFTLAQHESQVASSAEVSLATFVPEDCAGEVGVASQGKAAAVLSTSRTQGKDSVSARQDPTPHVAGDISNGGGTEYSPVEDAATAPLKVLAGRGESAALETHRADAAPCDSGDRSDAVLPLSGEREQEPVNFVELLTKWGRLLSMIARGPVQVNFGPYASLPMRVPEQTLERILVNLVHNAMNATRDGGSIRIGVGRTEKRRSSVCAPTIATPQGRMVLTVDDSGCGMSNQQIARLLSDRPGQESASAPHNHGGRGMGMGIVRELVASSGGELAIYSRVGAGTRIEIQWPLGVQQTGQQEQNDVLPERIPPVAVRGISPDSESHEAIEGRSYGLEGAVAC